MSALTPLFICSFLAEAKDALPSDFTYTSAWVCMAVPLTDAMLKLPFACWSKSPSTCEFTFLPTSVFKSPCTFSAAFPSMLTSLQVTCVIWKCQELEYHSHDLLNFSACWDVVPTVACHPRAIWKSCFRTKQICLLANLPWFAVCCFCPHCAHPMMRCVQTGA